MRRKAILFVVMIAAGVLVGSLAWLFGLSAATTDALAGAALGLLAGFGAPYAFGVGLRSFDAKDRDVVKAREAAISAEHRRHRPTPPQGTELPVVSSGLNEGQFGAYTPLKHAARGTILPSVPGLELGSEIIEVGHNGGIREPTG